MRDAREERTGRRPVYALQLRELDSQATIVAWVESMKLSRYVAKAAISPDTDLLMSVQGLAKRWNVTTAAIYKMATEEKLTLTVLEDSQGCKVGSGIRYAEIRALEAQQKRLKTVNRGFMLDPT